MRQRPMPTVMKAGHDFARVSGPRVPRSKFDLSRAWKGTFDAGKLVPCMLQEVLPGDTFQISCNGFARLATLLKPIMDNIYLDVHFWFVPNRLVWTNWEKFCGAQDSPTDSTDYVIPTCMSGAVLALGVADCWKLPTEVTFPANVISALPFRALEMTWNRWYRDQNLQAALFPTAASLGDGPDGTVRNLQRALYDRGKRHDFFTSCLPFAQKGEAVSLPLGTVAPVLPDPVGHTAVPTFGAGAGPEVVSPLRVSVAGAAAAVSMITTGAGGLPSDLHWEDPALFADLSTATAATINQLRQAVAVQTYLERDARGGTRYTEKLLAHFGVESPDARLQRPEYLGGGSVGINISPVAQTTASPATPVADDVQGGLAGVGTASWDRISVVKSFVEHGYMFCLVSARADISYQQGVERFWTRRTVLDFYWPDFAHLGEQPVLNREIYADGSAADEDVFGYQEPYADYRYAPSGVTGLFRSNHATPLDMWHLALNFASLPTLNSTFIVDAPPIDRVIAVPSEPHFIADIFFRVTAARPLPLFGIPGGGLRL